MSEIDVQTLLKRHGIDPKKSLGQNFMIQPGAVEKMAKATQLSGEDTVLEIGAGLGSLTAELAKRAGRVVALEIDQRLIPLLRLTFAAQPHVKIVLGNILEHPPGDLVSPDEEHYKVAANLPYYITSAVIRHLLEADYPPKLMALTVQKEVGERMAAQPGDMSLLAVSVQVYGTAEVLDKLKPGNFYPSPKIDSAVVRIRPHEEPLIALEDRVNFFRMVKAGFSQPRKQVKNPLAGGLHLDSDTVVAWLEGVSIDPRRRPETISVEEWASLYNAGIDLLKKDDQPDD